MSWLRFFSPHVEEEKFPCRQESLDTQVTSQHLRGSNPSVQRLSSTEVGSLIRPSSQLSVPSQIVRRHDMLIALNHNNERIRQLNEIEAREGRSRQAAELDVERFVDDHMQREQDRSASHSNFTANADHIFVFEAMQGQNGSSLVSSTPLSAIAGGSRLVPIDFNSYRPAQSQTSLSSGHPNGYVVNIDHLPSNLSELLGTMGFESLIVVPEYPRLPSVKKKLGCSAGDIQALPVFKFKNKHKTAKDHIECMICLQEFVEGEELRILPCLHRFHKTCIDPWLAQNDECCICKNCVKN